MVRLVLLALLLAASFQTYGEDAQPKKVGVWVSDDCQNDLVGSRVAYRVREELNRSTKFVSSPSYKDGTMYLSIVCGEPNQGDNGNISHYSWQITLYSFTHPFDFALTHGPAKCGSSRVADCAEALVVQIDQEVTRVREKIQAGKFKWPDM